MTQEQEAQPSRSGPHVVHFSDVKEIVEVESGRFEFFKQTLTVGLGGIAGLAAVFSDSDKVPDGGWTRASLAVFALSMIAVVYYSSSGISTYANYLRNVNRISKCQSDRNLISKRDRSEQGILDHARGTLVAAWLGAAALVVFAGLRLFGGGDAGPERAMNRAVKAVSLQPGHPIPSELDHFETVGTDYLITYLTQPNSVKYTVRVSRDKIDVSEIMKR